MSTLSARYEASPRFLRGIEHSCRGEDCAAAQRILESAHRQQVRFSPEDLRQLVLHVDEIEQCPPSILLECHHHVPEYMADALRRHESSSRNGIDPASANGDLLFFLLDLDRFKEINDRFGHAAGDRVLVDIHDLLKTAMRDTDTLVRWGGEEFLMIARNSSRHEAAAIAERIRSVIAGHAFIFGKRTTSLRLTCSIGFAPFPFLPAARARFGWQEVLDAADTCLYAAKHAGRNRTVGILAAECRDPETLIQRIRQSLHDVVAAGEVTLATGGESSAIAV